MTEAVEAIERGAPCTVILSRLGNGKTMLADCIAAKLRDRYDVYFYGRETLSLKDEIQALRAPSRPTLIVVDDYVRHLELIRDLRLGANENQQLLLASRTPTHLTARERLAAVLGGAAPVEVRVDTLREAELKEFDAIVAGAGLLGETAAWPEKRRIRVIYRERGEGELAGILLWLMESPAIRDRLSETFKALRSRADVQRVVVAAMILTHIGQQPDIDDIAEFIGAGPINRMIFSEDGTAADLVRFERGQAYPRSSLFAAAALRALWDEGHVPEVLQEILRRAWELRFNHERFRVIARDLMRYSKVRQIVPTNDQAAHILAYYERIRNMPSCVNNQLFWLQFALADLERKDFLVAERHLEQSYAIASRMSGFDTYQIDNVKAQFLLVREIYDPDPDRSFRSFVEASRVIGRQMRERRHAYYPFRVASRYGDFWRQIAAGWSEPQRSTFLTACKAVYDYAQSVDPDLAEMDDVRRCKEIVQTILLQTGRLTAH